jgi:hypothetical protein
VHARTSTSEGAGLRFGSHLHSALSLYYKLQEFDLPFEEVFSKVVCLLESLFASRPNDDQDWRNLNWAVEICQRYFAEFTNEGFELLRYKEPQSCKHCDVDTCKECIWCNGTGNTNILSEVPFVISLFTYNRNNTAIPIFYRGFIDLIVKRGDLYFVLDFKSTSKLGQSYWDDKKAIAQPKGYCFAAQELLGVKMHGYIIRALRTLEPPSYVLNNTPSMKGESKKIEDWWKESILEQRFDLGLDEIDEWKQNAIEQVKQFFYHFDQGYFPQNKTACVSKYGRCQYFEVCHTFPVSDRRSLLDSNMFKTKETDIIK